MERQVGRKKCIGKKQERNLVRTLRFVRNEPKRNEKGNERAKCSPLLLRIRITNELPF